MRPLDRRQSCVLNQTATGSGEDDIVDIGRTVLMELDSDGYFVSCPELKGCFSQGDSYDEAMKNIREAIALYIETLDGDQD